MTRDPLKELLPGSAAKEAAVLPVLMSYQAAWVADKSPLKVAEKSRRIGLTWAEAADNVETAARARSAGGMNVYYIGYSQDMAVEFIDACAMWARTLNLVCSDIEPGTELFKSEDGEKEIKTYTIRFPKSGFRIQALSSRPANLRGKQGVVVIDEAAFHDDLAELLKAALALLIWGGRVRVISTHNGDGNPFNELIQDIRAGKRKGMVHRTTFKEAVAAGLYERVCLRLRKPWDPDEETAWVEDVYSYYGVAAEEELDVVPSAGEGAVLPRAWIEACMVEAPVLRWGERNEFTLQSASVREGTAQEWLDANVAPLLAALPVTAKKFVGSDFARSGDLSVFVPLVELQDLRAQAPFVIEMRNIPFEQQRQVVVYVIERLSRFVSAAFDARGNGEYVAEAAMQRFGAMRIAQVKSSESWYLEHMPRMVSAFQDRQILLPRDSDLLDDLRQLRKVRGVIKVPDNAHTRGSDGGKRHGDAAIAIALALFARATLDVFPIEFQSTGARASGSLGAELLGGEGAPITRVGFGTVGGSNDFGGYE
jgi:phage FluMu gp28-like protein